MNPFKSSRDPSLVRSAITLKRQEIAQIEKSLTGTKSALDIRKTQLTALQAELAMCEPASSPSRELCPSH